MLALSQPRAGYAAVLVDELAKAISTLVSR
jgi:hypothetical protein